MNDARRKEIERARALLEEAKQTIETAEGEEQEYFDNMPENLQGGEKGERASASVEALSSACSSIEEAIGYLEEAVE